MTVWAYGVRTRPTTIEEEVGRETEEWVFGGGGESVYLTRHKELTLLPTQSSIVWNFLK